MFKKILTVTLFAAALMFAAPTSVVEDPFPSCLPCKLVSSAAVVEDPFPPCLPCKPDSLTNS